MRVVVSVGSAFSKWNNVVYFDLGFAEGFVAYLTEAVRLLDYLSIVHKFNSCSFNASLTKSCMAIDPVFIALFPSFRIFMTMTFSM